jgi:hypothetical protein
VDIRVKTFDAEAARRLAYLVDEFGFTGPQVDKDADAFTAVAVSYTNGAITVRTGLLLGYIGEEYVYTRVVVDRPGAGPVTTDVGQDTAHKGHEMRRALDRQSQALRMHLDPD